MEEDPSQTPPAAMMTDTVSSHASSINPTYDHMRAQSLCEAHDAQSERIYTGSTRPRQLQARTPSAPLTSSNARPRALNPAAHVKCHTCKAGSTCPTGKNPPLLLQHTFRLETDVTGQRRMRRGAPQAIEERPTDTTAARGSADESRSASVVEQATHASSAALSDKQCSAENRDPPCDRVARRDARPEDDTHLMYSIR